MLDMRLQLRLDFLEGLHAGGVCGAGCLSLADEIEDDIVLRVPVAEAGGSLGQGHHTVANEPYAIGAIDLAGGEARSLLRKSERNADDSVKDCADDCDDSHPRREPKASG